MMSVEVTWSWFHTICLIGIFYLIPAHARFVDFPLANALYNRPDDTTTNPVSLSDSLCDAANRLRRQHQLPPLAVEPVLENVATEHIEQWQRIAAAEYESFNDTGLLSYFPPLHLPRTQCGTVSDVLLRGDPRAWLTLCDTMPTNGTEPDYTSCAPSSIEDQRHRWWTPDTCCGDACTYDAWASAKLAEYATHAPGDHRGITNAHEWIGVVMDPFVRRQVHADASVQPMDDVDDPIQVNEVLLVSTMSRRMSPHDREALLRPDVDVCGAAGGVARVVGAHPFINCSKLYIPILCEPSTLRGILAGVRFLHYVSVWIGRGNGTMSDVDPDPRVNETYPMPPPVATRPAATMLVPGACYNATTGLRVPCEPGRLRDTLLPMLVPVTVFLVLSCLVAAVALMVNAHRNRGYHRVPNGDVLLANDPDVDAIDTQSSNGDAPSV